VTFIKRNLRKQQNRKQEISVLAKKVEFKVWDATEEKTALKEI
jgi:hypothetical protein